MSSAPQEVDATADKRCIMASIDRRPDGDYLIIADISCDNQWLAVPLADGLELVEHR